MKRTTLLLVILCQTLFCSIHAQRSRAFVDNIKTIELKVNGEKSALPILVMGNNDRLSISFDDLTHEYCRYIYKVEHCDFDWKVSEQLFESEYLSSSNNEEVIEHYETSISTTQNYTHYTFNIPNENMRPLLSGNYRVSIIADDTGELVAYAYFAVLEPRVNIEASVSGNTEIDWNKSHQQITMRVNTSSLQVAYPSEEIRIVVLQNHRWDNAVIAPNPSSYSGSIINWQHCKSLIFDAGNEYRKFEMLSTKYAGMGIDNIRPYGEGFYAQLAVDEQRTNYVYDEDQNGTSVIRTEDYYDQDLESDYVLTEFRLASPPLMNADVFITGQWNHNSLLNDAKMTYEEGKGYTAKLLLKQGYYNYMYLTRPDGKDAASTMPYEGNFFQTENEYTIFVYYTEQGGRYTRLVGHRTFSYRPN